MWFNISALASILISSLFIIPEVKSQSTSPSTSPSPSSTPSTSPSSIPSPSSSPSPPTTSPSPVATPLNLQTAAEEVEKIFDIIRAQSVTKDVDLFEIYSQHKSCQDRLTIEKAYIDSKFNFDKNNDDDQGLSDEDKDEFRLFMATFLTGCDSTIFYCYHLKDLFIKEDSVRGISGILVASSESSESNVGVQNNFNDRFKGDKEIKEMIEEAVHGDAKNVCLTLIEWHREKPLSSANPGEAQTMAGDLVKEESETKGWSNDRKKLDTALILTPLNQCQVVLENFKKDGKNLRQTFEEDFKDDEDKLTAYLQLYDFISLNTTFYSNELYYGLKDANDIRYPMRVYGSMKQSSDLIAIEKQFKQDHPDIQLREKVKDLTNSYVGYTAKFFQKVLDKQWVDADSSNTSSQSPSTAPSPPSTSSPTQTSPPPSPSKSPSPSPSPSSSTSPTTSTSPTPSPLPSPSPSPK